MNQQFNRDKIQERISREGLRPADSGIFGAPTIRYMLGWVLSLGILSIVVNLPISSKPAGAGWQDIRPVDQIKLLPMPPKVQETDQVAGSPVTVFTQPAKIEDPLPTKITKEKESAPLPEVRNRIQRMEKLDRGPILEFVDESPAIIGGLSTLYLEIDYPKIARDQGIEGLTVLMFVVETDGSTSDIQVIKPLHPALDAAAVTAVRKTIFKPGRMNGKIVRVKMRLPIRFRLIDRNKPARQDTAATVSDR